MAEIAAVPAPAPDPKAGKPRPKSETSAPYFDLDKVIEAVHVMYDRGGGRCSRAQLAQLLGYSGVKNGAFLTRMSAAKMFGLLEESGDGLVLSERAKKIVAPVRPSDSAEAKLDAFMAVELYRKVFDDFDGSTLPGEAGLMNLLANKYGVVQNQVKPALRNLLESAETAGLFQLTGNRSKMVRPILSDIGPPSPPTAPPPPATPAGEIQERRRGGSFGGGGGGDGGIHPALAGLLRTLPPPTEKLGPKRRQALIDAFKSTINVIYPEEED